MSGRTSWLRARGTRSIVLIPCRGWERGQPRITADGPQFVGGFELVGSVHRSKVQFILVAAAPKHSRSTVRAEVAALVCASLTVNLDRIRREDGRRMEQGSMVLSAIQAMTDANAVGLT